MVYDMYFSVHMSVFTVYFRIKYDILSDKIYYMF